MSVPEGQIAQFFRGRTVFVTGASGFMGKVLIEKLLYTCPDLRCVYILVRNKRSRSAQQRTEEMFKISLFNRIRKERPDALQKVFPINGDIVSDELGMSPENKARLQEEVSVVFHCAATLRLEASLKDAVEMNTRGTWRVLELAKGIKNLKVFIHLSTAFCHCDLEVLEEKTYDASYEPHDIMRVVQWMDETSLNAITPRLIEPHPNTYTFTKRLAEKLARSYYPDLPLAIARPSIVCPSYNDPFPGWVDSLNGPIGLLVGGGKGVIRSMHCRADYFAEVIPVDLAINALMALAWKVGTTQERTKEPPVINITTSSSKKVPWGYILEKGRKIVHDNPFEMTIWYPDGNIRSSKFMHNLCVIFLHFLPAYFIDFLFFLFRQKRFMVRLQHRIQQGLEVLQYFTTRQWHFVSSKFLALREEMCPEDRKTFFLDFEMADDDEYLMHSILGARQYCLKEPLSSLPRSRRNLKILYVVDRLWSVFFYSMLIWLVVSYSDTARHLLDVCTDCLKSMPIVRSFVALSDI